MAPSPSCLLFVNVPPKTLIGIDLVAFNSSVKFKGIKNVPSGLHFVYTGTDATLAIRYGLWLDFSPSALNSTNQGFLCGWNTDKEHLQPETFSSSTGQLAGSALIEDETLVDWEGLQYASNNARTKDKDERNSKADDWKDLTTYISTIVLSRVLGEQRTISSISTAPADVESIPGLSDAEVSGSVDTSLNFVAINLKQTWPLAAIGRERTDRARDRSWYLSQMLDDISKMSASSTTGKMDYQLNRSRQTNAKDLLGELQLCFVTMLTLANYSCLEQWKRILTVLFTCRTALIEIEAYFVEALQVFMIQLEHIEHVEGGMFDLRDEIASAWLRQLMSRFRKIVDDMLDSESRISEELGMFERLMYERYGWELDKDILRRGMVELEDGERIEVTMEGADEDEETGEYAPVVVEI